MDDTVTDLELTPIENEVIIMVTGSRHYQGNITPYLSALETLIKRYYQTPSITLIHGNAAGADTSAAVDAGARGWIVTSFPALWKTYGLAAGPIRNQQMIQQHPHLVLALLAPDSTGTASCLRDLSKSLSSTGNRLVWILLVEVSNTAIESYMWLTPTQLAVRFK